MPKPKKGESKNDYMNRCMKSKDAKDKRPNAKDRVGYCMGVWRSEKKNVKNNSEGKRENSNLPSIKLNFKAKFKSDKEIIVPVVAMKEGVHDGSHGPVFYPAEEFKNSEWLWNGISVPIGHHGVTVGFLYGVYYDEEDKAIKGDVHLDIERISIVKPKLLDMIFNGEEIHVSAAIIATWIDREGVWEGEKYDSIGYDFEPVHLAILVDEEGACSFKDGCGIRENLKTEGNLMDRKEAVKKIVENKKMGLSQESVEFLNGMDEDTFKFVENLHKKFEECECMENDKAKDEKIKALNTEVQDLKSKVEKFKAEKEEIQNSFKNVESIEEYVNSAPEKIKDALSKIYNNYSKKTETVEEYIENAPKPFQEVLNESIRQYNNKKSFLIGGILKNSKNRFPKEKLETLSLDEIEAVYELAKDEKTDSNDSYVGNAGNRGAKNNQDKESVPDIPKIDWTKVNRG